MPIYEYRCENGHQFEVIQRMTDAPVSECMTCSEPVVKVFHPVAVHFKGSGFYNTDYGTRKRARETKESKESSNNGSGSSESTSGSSESTSGASSGGSDSGAKAAKTDAATSTSSKPTSYSSD
ncbi:MAG: FmdB family zinc ribbon protein [Solirubrobacteraceae bacterium]